MPQKLLFVCLGNICRSPAAENIMHALAAAQGIDLECDSAGTANYHTGAAPDRRMTLAAQRRGITLTGRARQFSKADFSKFDLILAMDRSNYDNIMALDPERKYQDRVKMICEFCTTHGDQEVPDPYYGGEAGFDYVIDLLTDACQGLLQSLCS